MVAPPRSLSLSPSPVLLRLGSLLGAAVVCEGVGVKAFAFSCLYSSIFAA